MDLHASIFYNDRKPKSQATTTVCSNFTFNNLKSKKSYFTV